MAVRPELRRHLAAITPLAPSRPRYLGLPRTGVRLLVRQSADGSRVDVYAVGPRTSAIRKPAQPHGALAFELSPGAVPALVGIATHQLAGHAVSLAELWGRSTDALLDELCAAPPAAYAAIMQAALIARLARNDEMPRAKQTRLLAHARCLLDDPRVRIAEIASQLGVSDRHLRRLFDEAIGLSPKRYASVSRLHRAIRLASRSSTAWARVALEAGYCDQAHMIGEFRAATGATPAALLAELATSDSDAANPQFAGETR